MKGGRITLHYFMLNDVNYVFEFVGMPGVRKAWVGRRLKDMSWVIQSDRGMQELSKNR